MMSSRSDRDRSRVSRKQVRGEDVGSFGLDHRSRISFELTRIEWIVQRRRRHGSWRVEPSLVGIFLYCGSESGDRRQANYPLTHTSEIRTSMHGLMA